MALSIHQGSKTTNDLIDVSVKAEAFLTGVVEGHQDVLGWLVLRSFFTVDNVVHRLPGRRDIVRHAAGGVDDEAHDG